MFINGATVNLIRILKVKSKHHPRINRQYYTAIGIYECGCGKRIRLKPYKAATRKSCGCLRGGKTHGLRRHPLYGVWNSIKSRCCNRNSTFFHRYGSRGISICESWNSSFNEFYTWSMNNGWKHGLSIERIDNDSGYNPINCKFIPRGQQARNRSTSKLTMKQVQNIRACYDSGLETNAELARRYNITPTTMCKIVHRKIWKEGGVS